VEAATSSEHLERRKAELAQLHGAFGTDQFGAIAEKIARLFGTPQYILGQTVVVIVWIILNALAVSLRWDPYPFILLNLFLSMLAAIQAPVIMMSQNRQDAKDRVRADLDYQVNLKAELEIMELHRKLDRMKEELFDLLAEMHRPGRR
jgi:uncharacterized membrane protein